MGLALCMRGEIQRWNACYDRVTSETSQKQLVRERKKHIHNVAPAHTYITAHGRLELRSLQNHMCFLTHLNGAKVQREGQN